MWFGCFYFLLSIAFWAKFLGTGLVQLDPIILDAYLAVAFGFGLVGFYCFTAYFLYPFFLQTTSGELKSSIFAKTISLAPEAVPFSLNLNFPFFHSDLDFSVAHPFSDQFAIFYSTFANLFVVDKFFQFVYSQRLEHFFFCVEEFFLLFESGLEEFDIYCRVNQSLLRFKHRFFY